MAKRDFVKEMDDQGGRFPAKLRKALNDFFSKHPEQAEGCIARVKWDGNGDVCLIIESSQLYDELNGYGFSWDVHTAFYDSFNGCGYHPEMVNSCIVGFYKD